ncbi:MAG: phage major capsid protein, partial [Gallionellaceae bacterium]
VGLNIESSGGAGAFVDEGAPAPFSAMSFGTRVVFPRKKLVVMYPITDELPRSTSGLILPLLTRNATKNCIQACDRNFIDPSNAGSTAGPAAVSYGAPTFVCAGGTVADLDAVIGAGIESLINNKSTLDNVSAILHPNTLTGMKMIRNSSGNLAYPDLTAGNLFGLNVISSASVPYAGSPISASIILLDSSRVWVADEGELFFEVSRYGTVESSDSPTNNNLVPTAANLTSLFQTSSMACRLTRYINWKIGSTNSCAVISGVPY